MIVIGINYLAKWVRIIATHGTYTCRMAERDGKLLFKFKNKWYDLVEYASDDLKKHNLDGLGFKEYYQRH